MAEEKHAVNRAMVAVNTASGRPELPDLIIEEILRRLPTKAAVRLRFLSKQWEGILSSAPTLDFDEGGDDEYDLNKLEQRHYKFINMFNRFLLECEKNKQKQVLDKFKLRMTSFSTRDNMTVTKLLSHSFERSVKEIDISTKDSGLACDHRGWLNQNLYYGGLARRNLVSVKSLTSLKLEYVRIRKLGTGLEPTAETCLFPSLKSISFNCVHFDDHATLYFFPECPAVEYVSLVSCTYAGSWIHITSSSLKSLVIKRCWAKIALVRKAVNLESVTIVSSDLKVVILTECSNLKYIDIQAQSMVNFHLKGCHDVNGTINARNLSSFSFEGYLMKSKFSLSAPRLKLARIILWDDIWDVESSSSFDEPWKHFPKLTDFLKQFGSSEKMILVLHDFKALIFPKDFRKTLSSSAILPKLKYLDFRMNNFASASARDTKELTQSLQWMAPSVKSITPKEYNAEESGLYEEHILNHY